MEAILVEQSSEHSAAIAQRRYFTSSILRILCCHILWATVSFRAYISSWWRTERLTRGRRGRRRWTRRKWFANRFDTMVYFRGLWSHAYCRRMFLLSRTWGAKSKVRWIRFDFLATIPFWMLGRETVRRWSVSFCHVFMFFLSKVLIA